MTNRTGPGGPNIVVNTMLVANLLVFFLWSTTAVPVDTLADNFLVSWDHLEAGRIWTLLTSVFSHNFLFHLLVNMIVLLSFGPPMERLMGSGRFLAFYLIAGIVGSVAHVSVSRFLLGDPTIAALGASGALAGVLLLFSLTFPKATVLMLFVIPVPAIIAALLFVGIDIWGLMMQIDRGGAWPIGHGAHLGGALTGLIYFLTRRRALREAQDDLVTVRVQEAPYSADGAD